MSEFKNVLLLAADAVIYFAVLAALFRARATSGHRRLLLRARRDAFSRDLSRQQFLRCAAARHRRLAGLDRAVHRQADAAASRLYPGRRRGGASADLRPAGRQPAAVRARRGDAQPRSGRAGAGARRRSGLPRRDGRLDDLGNRHPVPRLHPDHPALRALARLAGRPGLGAAGARRRGRPDLRPGDVLRRAAPSHRRGPCRAVRRLGREDGRGRALQRSGSRLSALARAAAAPRRSAARASPTCSTR